jgi:hypothetical protein
MLLREDRGADRAAQPGCPACSRPILSGRLVFYQHGELFHVRCASEALGLKIAEMAERARDAQTRAAEEKARADPLGGEDPPAAAPD